MDDLLWNSEILVEGHSYAHRLQWLLLPQCLPHSPQQMLCEPQLKWRGRLYCSCLSDQPLFVGTQRSYPSLEVFLIGSSQPPAWTLANVLWYPSVSPFCLFQSSQAACQGSTHFPAVKHTHMKNNTQNQKYSTGSKLWIFFWSRQFCSLSEEGQSHPEFRLEEGSTCWAPPVYMVTPALAVQTLGCIWRGTSFSGTSFAQAGSHSDWKQISLNQDMHNIKSVSACVGVGKVTYK